MLTSILASLSTLVAVADVLGALATLPSAQFVRIDGRLIAEITCKPKVPVFFPYAVGLGCRLADVDFDAGGWSIPERTEAKYKISHRLRLKLEAGKKERFCISCTPGHAVFAVVLFAYYVLPVGIFVRIDSCLD